MVALEDTDALILAYVDGEMDASAARAFEARLAGDADLRAEVEGLQATKALLGKDAQWGVESGTDAPPPHLLDAIVRAELIARPQSIKDAAALVATKKDGAQGGFTARLSRWLLGGGLLVGGAAAVLFVVTRSGADLEPPMATAASDKALHPDSLHKADALARPAEAREANRVATKMAESAAPKDDAPPSLEGAAFDPSARADGLAHVGDTLGDSGGVGAIENASGAGGLGRGAGARGGELAGGDLPALDGEDASRRAPAKEARPEEAKKSSAGCDPVLDFDCKRVAASAGPAATNDKPSLALEEKPAKAERTAQEKAPPTKPKPADAPVVPAAPAQRTPGAAAGGTSTGSTGGGFRDFGFDSADDGYADSTADRARAADKSGPRARKVADEADAPTSPPAAAPATTSPPPPPPADVPAPIVSAPAPEKKPANLKEAREQLLKKRRESARKPVPDLAPKLEAKADAKGGAKNEDKAKENAGKAKGKKDTSGVEVDKKQAESQPMSPRDVRAAEEANMAFSTGLRELKEKRYREALDSFSNAERLDRRRTLGVSVVIAQMRAYAGLKRLPDVARLSARLLSADVKSPDVVDGMMMGVDAAEKTGDTFLAEQLWTRLLEVPDKKALAQRGLERTRRPMRAPAPAATAPVDMDDDRAAESEAQK